MYCIYTVFILFIYIRCMYIYIVQYNDVQWFYMYICNICTNDVA